VFDGRSSAAAAQVIAIQGAREHNLKNISLAIPRDQLVVVTGVSGSGKAHWRLTCCSPKVSGAFLIP
jgi:ABC-type taurine transport system ATPase subunit